MTCTELPADYVCTVPVDGGGRTALYAASVSFGVDTWFGVPAVSVSWGPVDGVPLSGSGANQFLGSSAARSMNVFRAEVPAGATWVVDPSSGLSALTTMEVGLLVDGTVRFLPGAVVKSSSSSALSVQSGGWWRVRRGRRWCSHPCAMTVLVGTRMVTGPPRRRRRAIGRASPSREVGSWPTALICGSPRSAST